LSLNFICVLNYRQLGSTCNNTRIKVNFRYHSNYHLPHAGFFLLAKYFTNSTVYFLKSILLWMKFKNKVSKSGIDFIFSDVNADNNSIKRILILSRLYYKFFWKKLDIKGKKCVYTYIWDLSHFLCHFLQCLSVGVKLKKADLLKLWQKSMRNLKYILNVQLV
jgi:hypothetical protein